MVPGCVATYGPDCIVLYNMEYNAEARRPILRNRRMKEDEKRIGVAIMPTNRDYNIPQQTNNLPRQSEANLQVNPDTQGRSN